MVQMSEEVRNPSLVVPQSVCISILINGTAGLAMMIAMLFCIGDVERVTNSKTGFPVMEIFLQATKSVPATAVMASAIFVLLFCATVGLFTSTSRLVWSFSRDHGLPFWRTLARVHTKSKVPYWAVIATAALPCLLALINLGSHVAINALLSLSISSLYASYLAAASLLLYRRCTKSFKTNDGMELPELANTSGGELVWGPWHIPGMLGIVNNAFACVYLIVILFFSFWPPGVNPEPNDMNWSILVTGCVVILSVVYYLAWGKREYHGPVVET